MDDKQKCRLGVLLFTNARATRQPIACLLTPPFRGMKIRVLEALSGPVRTVG
jgi:hypothetical protein